MKQIRTTRTTTVTFDFLDIRLTSCIWQTRKSTLFCLRNWTSTGLFNCGWLFADLFDVSLLALLTVQSMAPPFDLHALGTGQPDGNINEDFSYYNYNFFNYHVPTLAPSVATYSGSHDLLFTNTAPASDSAAGFNIGREESYFCGEASKYVEIDHQSLPSYPECYLPFGKLDAGKFMQDGSIEIERMPDGVPAELQLPAGYWLSGQINEPRMEAAEQGKKYLPPSPLPFGSHQTSNSTPTSGHATRVSSLELEDESAEDLNNSIIEDITSWPAAEILFPAIEVHKSFVSAESPCRTHQSIFKEVSKNGIYRKRKRSAEPSKFSAEIRISKKIPTDGKHLKKKAWLGTFATPAQKERALDVGKYFLSAKKKKKFSNPESEAILSAFENHLQQLPLTELVEAVTKLAKYYGEKGSLPQSLDCL
ncbi:hypothetical protein M758_6G022900 [Ceratodon purpureus]|nr:hypothetical protein M758_6G022900 [Ceratodon purpureus]